MQELPFYNVPFLLVARGKFLTATLNFLSEGHTHEDVDRFFSYILVTVLRRRRFEVPQDLVDALRENISDHVKNKGEELDVQLVGAARGFEAWLAPLGVTLTNTFMNRPKNGKETAHSFTFKVRADLSPQERADLRRRWGMAEEHPEDVFCVTKGRMYMTKGQAPVLVLPHSFLPRVSSPTPTELHPRAPLEKPEKDNLTKLAAALEGMPRPYLKAAEVIRNTLREEPQEAPCNFRWLGEAAPPREAVQPTGNRYYEHLPDTSWNLLATFHRQPAAGGG